MAKTKKLIKHTPGPWKVEPDYYGHYTISKPKDKDRWVFYDIDPTDPTARANAQLIEQAPNLLQLCNDSLILFQRLDTLNFKTKHGRDALDSFIDALKEVIKNAELRE